MIIERVIGYVIFVTLLLINIYLIYTILMNKSNIKRLNKVLVLLCDKFELEVSSLNNELDSVDLNRDDS